MAGLKEKFLEKAKSVGLGLGVGVVTVGAIIGGIVETGTSSTSAYSGDWSSYIDLGDYIVKTDESGAMPALTKEQLKTAIDECYSGKAHDNYISELDSFISMQSKYKVNAAFAFCVAQTESTGGTGWDLIDSSTYNWYSIQGSAGGGYIDRNGTSWNKYSSFSDANDGFGSLISNNYFSQNKKNVDTVGTIYCDPPTVWSNTVKQLLDKMYASVVPEGGNAEAASGDGYTKTYSYLGKTYKLYEQWTGSYCNNSYGNSTISSYGCGPSCVAIVSSGYGVNKNPGNVVSECSNITSSNGAGSIAAVMGYLKHYGLSYEHTGHGSYVFVEQDKTRIINHLKGGNPVILLIHRPVVLVDGSTSGTSDHYITLLGINEKNEVFVGDPGSSNTDGWTTMENLCNLSKATNYFLISK